MNFSEWKNYIHDAVEIEDVLQWCGIQFSYGDMICPNPSHGDRHLGSCKYDTQSKTYKCWACQDSGDLFSVVMKKKNLGFAQACNFIVENYNLEHPVNPLPTSFAKDQHDGKEFPFSPKELACIGLHYKINGEAPVMYSTYRLTKKEQEDMKLTESRSSIDLEGYAYCRPFSTTISDTFNESPELVQEMIYYKAQEAYQEYTTEYAKKLWNSPSYTGASMDEKRKILDRKHYLENAFFSIKKMMKVYGINVTLPAFDPDPKVKYSLKL